MASSVGKVTLNASEVASKTSTLLVTINVKGMFALRARLWLLEVILKVARRVAPIGVELKVYEQKPGDDTAWLLSSKETGGASVPANRSK